jgi:dihydropteroate synthase
MNPNTNFPDLSTPAVMGILNVTPDSFFDGGRYTDEQRAIDHVGHMLKWGASIIDIGGVSTRPGAKEISPEEEWSRIGSVIRTVRKEYPDTCFSVDTFHAGVAEKALDAGADMVNDISGGTFDPGMVPLIGKRNVPFVIMHIQGRPGNMQQNPHYENVVEEIRGFFEKQIALYHEAGATNFILDPGFGFGKNDDHNYTLLSNLHIFAGMGYPVMVGLSRKSMINRVLGTKVAEAMNGTSVVNTVAVMNGAKILRVHDVKEAVEVVKLVGSLKSDI